MKKTIAAVAIGLSLLAGQAIAQNGATARIADRVGAPAAESSEFAGGVPAGLIFLAVTIAGFAIITSIDDDGVSD